MHDKLNALIDEIATAGKTVRDLSAALPTALRYPDDSPHDTIRRSLSKIGADADEVARAVAHLQATISACTRALDQAACHAQHAAGLYPKVDRKGNPAPAGSDPLEVRS
jgi:hypothetical protein